MLGKPGTTSFRVVFGERVSGDHRGVIEGTGQSVLAETKTILEGNLTWSKMREHQPERLTLHYELGGLSLLVWVHSTGVYIMRWPIPGFAKPRDVITPARAAELATTILFSESRNSGSEYPLQPSWPGF
jgi:hypothetical protein